LTGQLEHNTDTIPTDNDIQNNVHSIFDYGGIPGVQVFDDAIDLITTVPDPNGYSGMYPNYTRRGDADASAAFIDANGNSDPNGTINRYSNLELPMYHLSGWWDIFVDGQLDTYQHVMDNTSSQTQSNQKIVIGPWTHPTIGETSVGDITYPASVLDLNISPGPNNFGNVSSLFDSELVDWLRYLMNYNDNKYIKVTNGRPLVLIAFVYHQKITILRMLNSSII
jgi:hypothetical protein